MIRESKTLLAITFCTLIGILFAGMCAYAFGILFASFYSTPSDPEWTSLFSIGVAAGFSHSFLTIAQIIYRHGNQITLNNAATSGRRRTRLKLLFTGVACAFIALPACYIVGSILFPNVIRNWIDAIPCLGGGIFFYLGLTYPYSFKCSS
jgi:hypothetical protein